MAVSFKNLGGLTQRTEYETWLLDAVYAIGSPPGRPSELVYPIDGRPPNMPVFLSAHISIGDWRPGFLKAGAPLVFVTTFKLLDMLMEWVIEANSQKVHYKFSEKLKQLAASITFPPAIQKRAWLRDRLCGMYRVLKPLRGTVIHHHQFTSADGCLTISPSHKGAVRRPIVFSASDLRLLAKTVVTSIRLVLGSTHLDETAEKSLRHDLDSLTHLHGEPSLRQRPPEPVVVKKYVEADGSVAFDAAQTSADAQRIRPNSDIVFQALEVLERDLKSTSRGRWIIPWNQVPTGSRTMSSADLAQYATSATGGAP